MKAEMINVNIDSDDDFWIVRTDGRGQETFPSVFKSRLTFQKWIEDSLPRLRVKYCAMYDGKVSDFSCYGNRVLYVTKMFDEVYKRLATDDSGYVGGGNWSIGWSKVKE